MITDKEIQATWKKIERGEMPHAELLADKASKGAGALYLRLRTKKDGRVSASWCSRWMFKGQRGAIAWGSYPEVKLVQARTRHRIEIVEALAEGRDPKPAPAPEVEPAPKRPTAAALFAAYADSLEARGHKSKDTARQVRGHLLKGEQAFIKSLPAGIAAGDVTDDMVRAHLRTVYDNGKRISPAMAKRAHAWINRSFTWGKARKNDIESAPFDWGLGRSPAEGFELQGTQARRRLMRFEEIRSIWRLTPEQEAQGGRSPSRAVLKLATLTGQRIKEILRARGNNINLERRYWLMPQHSTKVGDYAHVVALTDQTAAILQERIDLYGGGLLFPSQRNTREPMNDTAVGHQVIRFQPGVRQEERWTARDCRRSFKNFAKLAGVTKTMINTIQQHTKQTTDDIYYNLYGEVEEKMAAMEKWEAWLKRLLDGYDYPEHATALSIMYAYAKDDDEDDDA